MTNKKILLVEDDQNLGFITKEFLELNDFDVTWAKNGMEGLEYFKKDHFHLCILDIMMPYKDGYTLAKEIRMKDKITPIIFLSAKAMKDDVLKGYKVGADDYLIKPFDSDVLLAKIKTIINRKKAQIEVEDLSTYEYVVGDFHLNTKLRLLTYLEEEPEKLSPKENDLLKLLIQYKEDLMPREVALTRIWKDDNYFTSRSMDVYIAKLRKYLKKDPRVEIINIHGEGFRLTVNEEKS